MHDEDEDEDIQRRSHALAELVDTELAYLADLRILVSVYLRLLPVLTTRRPLASASNPSIAHLARPSATSIRTLSHPHLPAPDNHPLPDSDARHLFSPSDLDAITRNAEDILDLHERLARRLRHVLAPLGIHLPSDSTHAVVPLHAINVVAAVFVDNVTSFDIYQLFCSRHSEAFDIVRNVQHRYPTEWDAFELRCAALAARLHSQDVPKWRHSLSSRHPPATDNLTVPALCTSESGHADSDTSSRHPRLMFMDYMIKPVQRVCKYPLLFDQLQLRSPSTDHDTVKTALWSMRTVASLVDEARRQHDLLAKSVQIVSRITHGLLTCPTTHNRHSQPASLSSFLSSLPPCHLSGALDVIHYRGTNMARLGTVRAKYLGAFLFPGAFLVLVKVAKPKAYEPKHWLNLREFDLADSNLDDVLLPTWFRLSSKAHMFEFAASCRREKDIWVDAIRCAIAEEPPWNDDPPSSIYVHFAAPLMDNIQLESISPLPTIQSIPELDDVDPVAANPMAPPPLQSHFPLKCDNPLPSSRRSSIITVSTPVPESNTFHLVRSTASAREQVDRGLMDVFSEKCLTARFHAHTHEEDFFEAQRVTRSFSRSTSALTMASAMSVAAKNRLTKRESVLVPRKRSFIEGNGTLSDTENSVPSTHSLAPKHLKRRQHPSKLKIVAMSKPTSQEGDEDRALESPSAISHCSSVSFVPPTTPLTTPPSLLGHSGKADSCHSHPEFLSVRLDDCAPKRSRSMIENVRGLFAPRSTPPSTALSRESSTRSTVSNSSLLKWWSRESLRRRVRSAPDVPREELPSTVTARSLHVEATTQPLLAVADRPYSQPDLHCLGSSATEFGVDDPSLQKSRGFRRRWTSSALPSKRFEDDSEHAPARIRRNFSFLHRFTQSTREDIPP